MNKDRASWVLSWTIIQFFLFCASGQVWQQQGPKLVGDDTVPPSIQGYSSDLSSSGDLFAVGGYLDNNGSGSIWVFKKDTGSNSWLQDGPKIAGSTFSSAPSLTFGTSLAMSASGDLIAVGAPGNNDAEGAAYVLTKTDGVWHLQASVVGTGGVGPQYQGSAVSLNGAGDTLAVGGNQDNNGTGAVWIFKHSGLTWEQQGEKLTAGPVGTYAFGDSVDLSSDGTILAVGGPDDNDSQGAAWIYELKNGVWDQIVKLLGAGGDRARLGISVALSADGLVLAAGGMEDQNLVGAVWMFTQVDGVWSQVGSKLTGNDAIGPYVLQGGSVSLSANGNTLAFGGNSDTHNLGATWVFVRNENAWTQQGSKLFGSGAVGVGAQGSSVSLSASGDVLIIGGENDNTNTGATWVFERVTPPESPTPAPTPAPTPSPTPEPTTQTPTPSPTTPTPTPTPTTPTPSPTQTPTPAPTQTPTPTETPGTSPAGLTPGAKGGISVLVIFLVFGACGGWWYFKRRRQPEYRESLVDVTED